MTLNVTRGLPYAVQWRVTDGKNIWADINDFEVRSQLRKTKLPTSLLIANLHDFMSKEYGVDAQANDIIVKLIMTGAQTRALSMSGFFDVILSDPGVEDVRGLEIYSGKIKLSDTTTEPEDEA